MKYFLSVLFFGFNFFQGIAQNSAPVLIANGNEIYCPLSLQPIVSQMSIFNDSNTEIDAVFIQISEGYEAGQDLLSLTGNHPNITSSWSALEGKLTLAQNGVLPTLEQFEAAVEAVVFSNSNPNAIGQRTFSITIGEANFLEATGHYYLYIPAVSITWNEAKIAAENSTYFGLQGYLATVTSMDEVQITSVQAAGAGWIGGNDVAQDNVWRWVTGPENGTIFWNGLANGSSPNFAFWNTGEPNNFNGNESYAHVTAPGVGIPGSWNDLSNEGGDSGDYQPKGYIVEYGGMPGDPELQIATTTTLTIPGILTVNNNSRCDEGNLSLSATAVSGTVAWFTQPTGGNPVFTSNTYQTPPLTTTTVFYVQDVASLSCNNITRTPVTATINSTPSFINIPLNTTVCKGFTASLAPVFDFGTLRWFDSINATVPVFTGNTFVTPELFENTTYYVEVTSNNCTSPREAVQVFVNPIPVVSDEVVFICQNSTVTLFSGNADANYLWSNGETTQNIIVESAGNYSVTITNSFDCSAVKNFEVVEVQVPIIENIETTKTQAIIQVGNEGNFEFSINGIDFFDHPVFNINIGGLYTAYVRGKDNDCGITTQNFVFITIPSFFSPNNDGNNDFWLVRGIENFPQFNISIFDRFGKLLFVQSRGFSGWNGTYNNTNLPATDYWFLIEIKTTNQTIKGNFSLIR